VAVSKTTQAVLAGNNLIIVLALASLLAVGAAGVIDKTLVDNIIRNQKVLTAKAAADDTLADDVKNAPQLVDAYTSLGALNRVLSDALPTTANFPDVLVTIENMAGQSGVRLGSVSPANNTVDATAASAPATSKDGTPLPKKLHFTVTFSSTYESLVNFMRDLELSARPMRVINVQLSGGGSALSGQLDIETFYQDKATLPFTTEVIK
jgi:Tfp pilus assembly protein PilO